jgi:arylsulfatase A-like enzyme
MSESSESRRAFLKGSMAAAVAAAVPASAVAQQRQTHSGAKSARKPNIIYYVADQMRWDFLGAQKENSTTLTPNLDSVAARGTRFATAVTNQPVCSPSRSVMLTGRYATETGVWHNARQIDPSLPTLASVLRENGYTANFIGKWHLAPGSEAEGGGRAQVKPEFRAGFLDHWEGANEYEWTTHPYEGSIWDGDGNEIKFKDQYRVEFLTDRVVKFLEQEHEKPFVLFVSQLEPHFQNDVKHFVGPNGSKDKFANPFAPHDLRDKPGDWQAELPDYYGCIASIDDSVGRILKTLEQRGMLDNTIFMFSSDHGCHFKTRNVEYKRSPHNASIRIPLIAQGPGFDHKAVVDEVVGNIHITPTLLDSAGVNVPESMKGKSLLPLIQDQAARKQWKDAELIQISEAMTARAVRTKDWTYSVVDPSTNLSIDKFGKRYQDYLLYDQRTDPYERVNLSWRLEYQGQVAKLRELLKQEMALAGEPEPEFSHIRLYY